MGVSLLNATLDFKADGGIFPSGALEASVTASSVQRNYERFSLTAEYSLLSTAFNFGPLASTAKSESLYLQGDCRVTPQLKSFVRVDNGLGDREQPNETNTLILTLGAHWTPNHNWHIATEVHGMRGTAGIPLADNPVNPLYARTELFVIIAGYRF